MPIRATSFTNLSSDIQRLFCESCNRLGIRWTRSSYKNISVADRRSVTLLDSFIGPKN
jgi:RNase P subunit RPR2